MKCAPHDGGVRNEEPDPHGWGSFFYALRGAFDRLSPIRTDGALFYRRHGPPASSE